jgi:hypothetical protein
MHGNRPNFFPLILAILLITGVFVTTGPEGLSQSAATVVAIATMEVGAAPAAFKFVRTGQGSPGKWTVVRDETSFSDRVIEQSSADRTDYRFPLAIYEPVVSRNIDVSIRFKPVAGRVDQAGGIAVRVLDEDNYYVVRANALEDNVRFYRVVKGRREQIAGKDTKVASGAWHSLGLKAQDDRFTIKFDGKTLFTTADRPSRARERLLSGQNPTASRGLITS